MQIPPAGRNFMQESQDEKEGRGEKGVSKHIANPLPGPLDGEMFHTRRCRSRIFKGYVFEKYISIPITKDG